MIKLGCHVGNKAPNYLLDSLKEALSYKANTFMLYSGAPQNSIRPTFDVYNRDVYLRCIKEAGINPADIIVHAAYIMNPASIDLEKEKFAIGFLSKELRFANFIGSHTLVLHPGSSVDASVEEAIVHVAKVINVALANNPSIDTRIAIETMAGKGREVGRTIDEVKAIIDLVEDKQRIGVCLDTCHLHDAGYDLKDGFNHLLDEIDEKIGLDKVLVVHLNDSKNPIGAHKDRHENIGKGYIGLDTLKEVLYNPRLNVPFILETPYIDGCAPYKEEIALLKEGLEI